MNYLSVIIICSVLIGCQNQESLVTRSGRPDQNSAANNAEAKSKKGQVQQKGKFGDGNLGALSRNSNESRCGGSYEASYIANSSFSHTWGSSANQKEAGADITSKVDIAGSASQAVLKLTTTINRYITSGNVSEPEIRRQVLRWDGNRIFAFYPAEDRAELDEFEGWNKADCAVLPVSNAQFEQESVRFGFQYSPPLPSLVSPNAIKAVYEEELAEKLKFKVLATQSSHEVNNNGVWTPVNYFVAKSKEFEISVELTKKDGDLFFISITPVFRDEAGLEITDETKLAELRFLAQEEFGIYTQLDYVIDTKERITPKVSLRSPYYHRAEASHYFFTDTITYNRQ